MKCSEAEAAGGIVRYLLVDDHEPFRHMLAAYLPEAHHEVAECANGREAVTRFKTFQPDWVLMDIEMPVLDGLEATRAILQRHPGARIIILTQYDSMEMERAALEAGAVAFLSKADLDALPNLLSRLAAVPSETSL